jgi:hypothetical protein
MAVLEAQIKALDVAQQGQSQQLTTILQLLQGAAPRHAGGATSM